MAIGVLKVFDGSKVKCKGLGMDYQTNEFKMYSMFENTIELLLQICVCEVYMNMCKTSFLYCHLGVTL